jgi:hypothetical protein
MKCLVPLLILLTLFSGNCFSQKQEKKESVLGQLFSFEYGRLANPDAERLSIIRYVLQNTYENNIHKMRGETWNRIFTNPDGGEAVFDKDGNLVSNYNKGGFNIYSHETEPVKKFAADIIPWLKQGSVAADPTSFEERLYYYTLDLDHGIQKYIFEGAQGTLEAVEINSLTEEEKEVYYIFLKLLYNEDYQIKLSRENIPRMRADGDYYYRYFHQIQETLGVKD